MNIKAKQGKATLMWSSFSVFVAKFNLCACCLIRGYIHILNIFHTSSFFSFFSFLNFIYNMVVQFIFTTWKLEIVASLLENQSSKAFLVCVWCTELYTIHSDVCTCIAMKRIWKIQIDCFDWRHLINVIWGLDLLGRWYYDFFSIHWIYKKES